MLSLQQKRIVHQYVRLAGIGDTAYRGILKVHTGFASCADRGFGQRHFDVLMAALEEELELQFIAGAIPDPVRSGNVRRLDYWRSRRQTSSASTRQVWRIGQLRDECNSRGSPVSDEYCLAIVAHATGERPADMANISESQAAALIDALSDRIHHV